MTRRTLTAEEVEAIVHCDVIANSDDLTRGEWLQGRRAGLGGSDLAAILGVSRWDNSYTLWQDKTGRSEASDDGSTLAQRRGSFLEPWILDEAQAKHDTLTVYRAPYQLRHRTTPILLANVDGLATDTRRGGWGGIEAKRSTPWLRRDWADGPPPHYEAQVQHYLMVTGLDWWLVAADLEGDEIETFVVERDEAMIDAIYQLEVDWWERHVIGDVEPDPDWTSTTTAALTVPADPGAVLTADTDDLAEIWTDLAAAKEQAAAAKELDGAARNRIRQLMAERTELLGDDGTKWATWRPGKDKAAIDYAAALTAAAERLGVPVDELTAPHTTTKPGPRTLRIDAGLKQIQEIQP